jgi:hypothetical protein
LDRLSVHPDVKAYWNRKRSAVAHNFACEVGHDLDSCDITLLPLRQLKCRDTLQRLSEHGYAANCAPSIEQPAALLLSQLVEGDSSTGLLHKLLRDLSLIAGTVFTEQFGIRPMSEDMLPTEYVR